MPELYYFLGTPFAGRRTAVRQAVEDCFEPTDNVYCLVSENELAHYGNQTLGAVEIVPYKQTEDLSFVLSKELEAPKAIFWLGDGAASPVDQMEALKNWTEAHEIPVSRIFMVVDCRLAIKPELKAWFGACMYFSDVIALNFHADVSQKNLQAFLNGFKLEYSPAIISKFVKGRLQDVSQLVYPEARRLTHVFDDPDMLDEDEGEDPYFERLDNGSRKKPIPEIKDFVKGLSA